MKKRQFNFYMFFLFISFSCAQKDTTIVEPSKEIYDIELIHPTKNIPWSLEFIDEKTIIYTEKQGKMYIVSDGNVSEVKGLPSIYERGQGGLMDIDIHPNFKENKLIFLSYASGDREKGGNTSIARAKLINNELINLKVIYKGEENTTRGQHFGSRIEIDNDGFLYFTIGDRGNRDVNPQDLTKDGGKVYRINIDGSIPDDNPFINDSNVKKAIYSYGHRNPQGLTIFKDQVLSTEHGPFGGDEFNNVYQGSDYGWPSSAYGFTYSLENIYELDHEATFVEPIYFFTPSIGISELLVYSGDEFPRWEEFVFVSSLKDMTIYTLKLNRSQDNVIHVGKFYVDQRVRDMAVSDDGRLVLAGDLGSLIIASRTEKDIP